MARYCLREGLKTQQLLMPNMFSAISARAAQKAGYKVAMVSGRAVSYALSGLPDMAMLSVEELTRVTEQCVASTDMAITVDFDDGYGDSTAVVYKNAQRLVQAGAQALQIEDGNGVRGFERLLAYREGNNPGYKEIIISRELWLEKIQAAVEACKGSDCFIIARTNAFRSLGMAESLERVRRARALGAECTTILEGALMTLEDGLVVNEFDPGLKMWPNIASKDGVPLVKAEEISKLGFNLVSCHVFEKGAVYGGMLAAKNNLERQNLSFVKNNEFKKIEQREGI